MVWGESKKRKQIQTLSMIPHWIATGIFGRCLRDPLRTDFELQEGINELYVTGLCYAATLQHTFSVKVQSKYLDSVGRTVSTTTTQLCSYGTKAVTGNT